MKAKKINKKTKWKPKKKFTNKKPKITSMSIAMNKAIDQALAKLENEEYA